MKRRAKGFTYLNLKQSFEEAVERLKLGCPCEPTDLLIEEDGSQVGAGSRWPLFRIICQVCNNHAVVFQTKLLEPSDKKKRVKKLKQLYKQLKKQGGWMSHHYGNGDRI